MCATSKNPESGWLAKDNPETNPVIIKLRATRQSSSLGFPTLLFSARAPLPNKVSCFVSTCVSSDNSFLSVRRERTLGPWKGSPFLQQPQALAQLFPIWLFPHCLSPLPSPLLLSSCCFSSGWLTQPPDSSPCTPALFSPAFLIYLLCTRCRIHKSQLLSCSSHIQASSPAPRCPYEKTQWAVWAWLPSSHWPSDSWDFGQIPPSHCLSSPLLMKPQLIQNVRPLENQREFALWSPYFLSKGTLTNFLTWASVFPSLLCPTLCDPKDCSSPGSSVHGDSPGKNTRLGCHALLQEIFLTQGSNPGRLHCRWILYHLSHQGSPRIPEWLAYPSSRESSWPRNGNVVSCIAGRFFTSWATREDPPSLEWLIKWLIKKWVIKMPMFCVVLRR